MLTIRDTVLIVVTFWLLAALNVDATPEVERLRQANERYAALIAACLNGENLAQGDRLVFCDPHVVRVK